MDLAELVTRNHHQWLHKTFQKVIIANAVLCTVSRLCCSLTLKSKWIHRLSSILHFYMVSAGFSLRVPTRIFPVH